MQYAEDQARTLGAAQIFCLSTQAYTYFQQKGGFTAGTPDDLPAARRESGVVELGEERGQPGRDDRVEHDLGA